MPRELVIKKSDAIHQVVFGEVYAPELPDKDGDWSSAEDIQEMAWDFLANARVTKIDTNHDLNDNGSVVVESFIARDSDPDFIPGSWVIGVKCDDATWEKVEKGELNGFSLWGMAVTKDEELLVEVPDTIWGETAPDPEDGHVHRFQVKYDDEGNFLGGMCEPSGAAPHVHQIIRGTVCEPGGGSNHRHRFNYIDTVVKK